MGMMGSTTQGRAKKRRRKDQTLHLRPGRHGFRQYLQTTYWPTTLPITDQVLVPRMMQQLQWRARL